ncbi:unnamed protein product [Citrullus colocynthis]|uniref:Uncharacterized protein n=1 Tax=Citrullus colocynthis TaxID=252529 RepID=A0ABP0Z791_9ROSI
MKLLRFPCTSLSCPQMAVHRLPLPKFTFRSGILASTFTSATPLLRANINSLGLHTNYSLPKYRSNTPPRSLQTHVTPELPHLDPVSCSLSLRFISSGKDFVEFEAE